MHARAPRARVKISTRIFGLPMISQAENVLYVIHKIDVCSTYFREIKVYKAHLYTIQLVCDSMLWRMYSDKCM